MNPPHLALWPDGTPSAGQCTHMPDLKKAAPDLTCSLHPVQVAHGYAWIWYGEEPPYDAPPWFDWLHNSLRRTLVSEIWDVPFDLAIENQMDHLHLSVVHPKTVGRNIMIDAPVTFTFEENHMRVAFDAGGFADFVWPSLWGTQVSDELGITIVSTPVSSHQTKLYLEGHRGFATNPWLGPLVDAGMRRFHKRALAEDRRIVGPQARWSADKDRLFQSDRAIRWFRNRLQEEGYTRTPQPAVRAI